MIVFQPLPLPHKRKRKLFYYQRTKKLCVIGEVKAIFFAIIVNWYKYQFTEQVVKNKIKYFIKIISLSSIKKLKFSCFLYYFNELFILF